MAAIATVACRMTLTAQTDTLLTAADTLRMDWKSSMRFVHIDNVNPELIDRFEGARKRWVANLRNAGRYQPDGYPLYWCTESNPVPTYFSLYPFRKWADLDLRSAAMQATYGKAGKDAMRDYFSGDTALVYPHRNELWVRMRRMDLLGADTTLTELIAAHGRLEYRRFPQSAEQHEMFDLWEKIKQILRDKAYGPSCQMYWDQYGSGHMLFFWLSNDKTALTRPDDWLEIVRHSDTGLGARFQELAPIETQLFLVRREDLSYLPAGQ